MTAIRVTFGLVALLTLLPFGLTMAAEEDAKPDPKPCTSDAHRDFDFWIGEWEVTTPARKEWKAHNSITVGNGGCSLHEHYTTPGGYEGSSVNFYDAANDKWHQTWIDNQGGALYLDGGLEDKAMVLRDATSRITWTVEPDGRVRQLWESTADEGKTWSVAFDGYYRKVE
jgi:hypothetical protein